MGGDGRNQPSGGGPDTAARGASPGARAEQVIEAGLRLYSQGDLEGALARWRDALAIDPDNRRARQYVSYVEEHYELLDRKLRGDQAAPADAAEESEEEEPGPTIEMEADDPMEEIDAYDSVEVSMPDLEPAEAAESIDPNLPTEEMAPHQLASMVAQVAGAEPAPAPGPGDDEDDDDDADDVTGEATKAEGLRGLRRRGRRVSAQPRPAPRPPVIEESVDEGWSLDDLDVTGGREGTDTLEIAARPGPLDDLSDLGTRAETVDPYAPGDDLEDEEDEPAASAIQRPSDDSTGEVTRPERLGRADSARLRVPSTAPPPLAPAAGGRPRSEFDLADFDDPGAPSIEAALDAAVMHTRPAVTADDEGEVRVTFRAPRDSDAPRPPAGAPHPPPAGPDAAGEEDEATVDRQRPAISFDDETYERPSLSMLAQAAHDLDSLDGEGADSDELALDRRAGSESDTGVGDASERETTQLYQRRGRLSQGAVSMELIAAELEADLDDAVSVDTATGEQAVKARVGWLIDRARSENRAGHFPVAVVAIDLALEQHPDSAVAQKLIHSNRDFLYEVYRGFLGDMRAVPHLAMPLEKIPMHELDHRAAFLLSRIDGALTLEDVLDVSGMARLEAFRHLSRLLLRGILELRT